MDTQSKISGRHLAVGIAGVAVTTLVAACGGASGGTTSPTTSTSRSTSTNNNTTRGPAASGKIAAVQPGSIEVQNSTAGQLTVNYTASTRITQTVAAKLSDITVGSCILAVSTSSTATTPTSITVSPATSGSCTRTDGFGGARPSGAIVRPGANGPSGVPSGLPSGFRSGGNLPGGTLANAITSGKVTAVSGSTITVAAISFSRPSASSSPAASPSTTAKTITVDSSTKIEKNATVRSAALKVGLCATAQGTTDTTGTVKATSIALTSPDSSGSCETGFSRFGAGGSGGAGGPGGAGGGTVTGGGA